MESPLNDQNRTEDSQYREVTEKGAVFEDLGSDFSRPQVNQSKPLHRTYGGDGKSTRAKRSDIYEFSSDSSSDELNSLPSRGRSRSRSRSRPAYSPPRKTSKSSASKSQTTEGESSDIYLIGGKYHTGHPEFKEKKYPKFTKIKKDSKCEDSTPQTTVVDGVQYAYPSSKASNTAKPPVKEIALPQPINNSKLKGVRTPFKPPTFIRGPPPSSASSSTTPASKLPIAINNPAQPLHERRQNEATDHFSTVARARMMADSDDEESQNTPRPAARPQEDRTRLQIKPFPLAPTKSAVLEAPDRGSERKTVPAPFPMMQSSHPSEPPIEKREARALPLPLPRVQSPRKRHAPFPMAKSSSCAPAAELSIAQSMTNGEAKTAAISITSDESLPAEAKAKKPGARPFPMAAPPQNSFLSSPSKRLSKSSEPALEDVFRESKRVKTSDELTDDYVMSDDDVDDDDLLFLDPTIDPATLCPWCDEPLPPAPSPHLESLIQAARRRSYRDARPTNPLGLHAPPAIFVGVCQRHNFESIQIPRASAHGWPTTIDWELLAERVRRFEHDLRAIVDDKDEEFQPGFDRPLSESEDTIPEGEEDEALQRVRPRKGSTFWRDVVKSVKKKGSRQTAGIRGQFSSFNKTQPGYYGELGFVIIHQTIHDLFASDTLDPQSTLPLIPSEFIRLVLVPEAAVALVMEDMAHSRQDAIRTLRESAEYGVAMFPDDNQDGDSDAARAGENFVRKRAQERRKMLESEEEGEVAAPRSSLGQKSGMGSESEDAGGAQHHPNSQASTRSVKPRARPKPASAKLTSEPSSSQPLPSPSQKPRRPGRPPGSKNGRSGRSIPHGSDADIEVCHSSDAAMNTSEDNMDCEPTPKPRRVAPRRLGKENSTVPIFVLSDSNDSDIVLLDANMQPVKKPLTRMASTTSSSMVVESTSAKPPEGGGFFSQPKDKPGDDSQHKRDASRMAVDGESESHGDSDASKASSTTRKLRARTKKRYIEISDD